MDVTIINESTFKIRGKNASIVINPTTSTPKTEADAILLLNTNSDLSTSKIEGSRITIKGPGEYEVSGIKVSTVVVDSEQVAKVDVDGIKLLVGTGASIEKIHDKIEEAEVAVINSDNDFNHSVLTSLEANVLLILGNKKEDVAKSLGKDEPIRANKYSISSDKLPVEMEVVLLG